MKTLPYFITWTKQKSPLTFTLKKVSSHELITNENKKIYDLSSLSYQASFGLKNTRLSKAISSQAKLFSLALPKNTFSLKEEVASRLNQRATRFCERSKKVCRRYKTFFTLSGSEGIENALKIVRQQTGRKIILARRLSYHGATMGALSVTGDWRNKEHLLPRQWSVRINGPEEDPMGKTLEETILKTGPENIAAFCFETITGANGVIIPQKSYYRKVQSLAKKYDIKIIMDEVICAFMRTGPFLGIDHYPFLRPDLIVLAKGITGGFIPFGALLVSEEMASFYNEKILSCGLTNYAHPLGLAATKAVLDLCEEEAFLKNLRELEDVLSPFSHSLKKTIQGIQTRQIGLLMAIDLRELEPEKSRSLTQEFFLKKGLYLNRIGDNIILAPHLTETPKRLRKKLKKLTKIVKAIPKGDEIEIKNLSLFS